MTQQADFFNRRGVLKGVGAVGATAAFGGLSGLVQGQAPISVGLSQPSARCIGSTSDEKV